MSVYCFADTRQEVPRLAVYIAFSDEAQVNEPDGEFLVGGYIAREQDWQFVARAWQERVLDGPPKIPSLHMTKMRSKTWRDRYDISEKECNRRVKEATYVLASLGNMFPVCCGLKVSDFETYGSLLSKGGSAPLVGADVPDYICFHGFVQHSINVLREHFSDAHQVNFIASDKQFITDNLTHIISSTRRFLGQNNPTLVGLLGDILPASSQRHLPLQAADILCWHVQRAYYERRHPELSFDPADANNLDRLTSFSHGILDMIDAEELRIIAKAMGESLANEMNP